MEWKQNFLFCNIFMRELIGPKAQNKIIREKRKGVSVYLFHSYDFLFYAFMGLQHGSIDRSGNSRGGGCSLLVVRMFHIFATDSASIG